MPAWPLLPLALAAWLGVAVARATDAPAIGVVVALVALVTVAPVATCRPRRR